MSDNEFIWVLLPDYGYEGLQEPFMAFRDEARAQACYDLIMANPSATSMKICKVPVWKD